MSPDPETLGALATRCEVGRDDVHVLLAEVVPLLGLPDAVASDLWAHVLYSRRSLDAVASLTEAMLPKGIWLKIEQCCENPGWKGERWYWRAILQSWPDMVNVAAPTEPLARLAAALRAKAAEIRGRS